MLKYSFMEPETAKFFQMAYVCQMKGDLQQAIEYYQKSIKLQPTAEAHTFLGWTYSFLEQLDEAIEECKVAISIDPDFGNPYNDIGAYLIRMGKVLEAIPWLERAKKAKRYDNPEYAYHNLAKIYESKGVWLLALEELQGALLVNPDYTPAKEGIERIENTYLNIFEN